MSDPIAAGPVLDGTPPKTPPSPKVIAAAVAGFVAPAILLGLIFLQTDEGQEYFGGLPKILIVIIGGLLASAVTYVSGYVKRDPIREAGARRALVE